MDGVWKTLTAPIIAAIIGGYALAQLVAPPTPSLRATVTWVDIPNPIRTADQKARNDLARAGQAATGNTDLSAVLDWSQYWETVRLAVVSIENNSALRSKEFELYLPEREGVIVVETARATTTTKSRAGLKPLDPDSSVRVAVFSHPWSEYLPMPVGLLHDGKKVDIEVHTATGIGATLVDWMARYPFVSLVAGAIFGMAGLLTLILIPAAILAEKSPEMRLKLTTKSELAKLARFLDWVREKHPAQLDAYKPPMSSPKSTEQSPAE